MSDQSFLPLTDDAIPDPDDSLDAVEDDDDDQSPFVDESDVSDIVVADDAPPPLGLSWAFDFQAGTFLLNGGHGPLETRGLATLRGWVEKCLMTARGAHPIHPPDYGVEGLLEVIGEAASDGVAGDLEDRIRDALLFHPRISDVTDFDAYMGDPEEDDEHDSADDETLFVSFTVVTDDEDILEFVGLPLRGA
jgi:hypothetical protein